MTPRKLKILLILAILCIVLFGALFRIVTQPDQPKSEQNIELTPFAKGEAKQGDFLPETTGTITDIKGNVVGVLPSTDGDLTILLPGRFYNDGFAQLAQMLKTKYNLTVRYKKIDNIGYYKKIIAGKEELEGIDLYLLPTDRLANYEGRTIALNEDIAPYVHPIFNAYNAATTLLPYAIDPLVTLTPSSTTLSFDNQLTFQDIANFITLESKANKIKMPILRGIDKNDKKILEQGSESFPNYFIITYNIISQIYRAGQLSNYAILLDTINNPTISKRSYANFKITFTKLLSKNPNCKTFPDICMLAYNYGDIKFGFLSDVSIEQSYVGGTGERITDLTIYNFPTPAKEYGVRGRGFVADKNTIHDQAIKLFAQEYIKAGANNSLPLRQGTLSAFNSVLDIQKIQKKYELIFKFEPQFSLLLSPITLQEQFLTTNFLTMILEKNPATGIAGFFEPTSWSR